MSIYRHIEYKEIIKKSLQSKKLATQGEYTFESLAQASRVQKTYLSRVLNHDGNLNRDQLYRACQFLGFSDEEIHYVFLVYDLELSQVQELKQKLKKEIHLIQEKQGLTESNIKLNKVDLSLEDMSTYYLDPYFSIIHMFLTIPKYASEPSLMLSMLGVDKKRLNEYLLQLEKMGIIRHEKNKWLVVKNDMHLSKTSNLYKAYRNLMHQISLEKLNRNLSENDYSFSVVFSSNEKVRAKIHEKFMNLLQEVQQLVGSENEDEVYQMNFDLIQY